MNTLIQASSPAKLATPARMIFGLTIFLATASSGFGQGKKSKGGNGNTSPTASIQFTITAFDVPSGGVEFANKYVAFQTINNQSQVVGNYIDDQSISAYFFDPLLHGNQAIDLNEVVQDLPTGQYISQAYDINDHGMILVSTVSDRTLPLNDPANTIIGGVIDSMDGFRFRTLPFPSGVRAHGRSINNSQDVAIAVYDGQSFSDQVAVAVFDELTDSWSLAPQLYPMYSGQLSDRSPSGDLFLIGKSAVDGAIESFNVLTPGDGNVLLPQVGQVDDSTQYSLGFVSAVNSWGDFVGGGTETQEIKRRGKTSTVSRSVSYLFTDQLELDSQYTSPEGLNNQLDYLAEASGAPVLVHRDHDSAIRLIDLADQSSAPGVDWSDPTLNWDFFDLNDRLVTADGDPTTDIPQICGHFRIVSGGVSVRPKAFLLTPVVE